MTFRIPCLPSFLHNTQYTAHAAAARQVALRQPQLDDAEAVQRDEMYAGPNATMIRLLEG